VISATRCSCYMHFLGCEWGIVLGFPPVMYICLQIGACICAGPTSDAVATGEVNCYNCIVLLGSIPSFEETIGQV